MLAKIASNQRIDLVKDLVERYIFETAGTLRSLLIRTFKMAASAKKPRPANVPEENVYKKTHWLLIVTYLVAASALYLLVSNAG